MNQGDIELVVTPEAQSRPADVIPPLSTNHVQRPDAIATQHSELTDITSAHSQRFPSTAPEPFPLVAPLQPAAHIRSSGQQVDQESEYSSEELPVFPTQQRRSLSYWHATKLTWFLVLVLIAITGLALCLVYVAITLRVKGEAAFGVISS